jgi:GDPmannose 4,6-dehydratase
VNKKTALITGISGQDGAYLAEFLLKKNYNVVGIERRSAERSNWRLEKLSILKKVIIEDSDIKEIANLIRIFKKYKFDEVYNLAAQSFVKSSFDNPIETYQVNAIGTLNLLEIIRTENKKIRFYQASTSEMFGEHGKNMQNELTNFHPRSPYASAKVFSHYTVQNYREAYKIFAVSGILFNHESPLRGEEFITRKISLGLAKIIAGKQKVLKIGNIYAKRDWGYAKDYIEVMWKMLQINKPQDFVIATGKTYSVKEFINKCVKILNLKTKWTGKGINEKLIDLDKKKPIIIIDKKYFRPAEVNSLKGNYTKAKKVLKWSPKTNLDNLAKIMIKSDLLYINKNKY